MSTSLLFLLIRSFLRSVYSFAVLCSPLWLMFVLYVFWGRRSFIDPICCNFCMVLSMFLRLVFGQSFIFCARHQFDTWTLAPLKTRGMAWFCGLLRVLGYGLHQSARIFLVRVFSGCYAILTSPKKGETAVCGCNPTLFWVLLLSCWRLAKLIFP